MLRDVITVILAGGKGTRLEPLTRDRAKPGVPFGGLYRIIDFTLSNCVNSGLRRIYVLTQFKSRSLDRHLHLGWSFLSPEMDEWIEVLPPQQRIDEHWYKGTADAIYQNIYSLEKDNPQYVLILSGDHIYKMDYADMVRFHIEQKADITIGCIPIPLKECNQFGIMEIEPDSRVIGFHEKPKTCRPIPDAPDLALGSMGIYIFNTSTMFDQLCEDAAQEGSRHDFGHNIIPTMIANGYRVYAHQFLDKNGKATRYWRDVGTLDAFYQANMDLVAPAPELNLYDEAWPIRTLHPQSPPPKFIHLGDGPPGQARRGEALDSLVGAGSVVSGGHVVRSILSAKVRINSYAIVEDSILFEGVEIGRYSRIRRAIIDKEVKLPPYTVLGHDHEFDRRRGFVVTEAGVVVIAKGEPPESFQAPNALPS